MPFACACKSRALRGLASCEQQAGLAQLDCLHSNGMEGVRKHTGVSTQQQEAGGVIQEAHREDEYAGANQLEEEAGVVIKSRTRCHRPPGHRVVAARVFLITD